MRRFDSFIKKTMRLVKMGTSGDRLNVHGVGGTNSKFTLVFLEKRHLFGSIPRFPKSHFLDSNTKLIKTLTAIFKHTYRLVDVNSVL